MLIPEESKSSTLTVVQFGCSTLAEQGCRVGPHIWFASLLTAVTSLTFSKKLHELKWPTRTRSMIKIYTQFWPVLRQEVCAPLITDTDRLASEVRRACNCVVLCQLLWSLACYIWSTVATVRGTDRRATSRAGFIILYSTLFAVEQYSSKKRIDEKKERERERETEQNNQKKQIYK